MAKISITDSPSGLDWLVRVQYFEDDGVTSLHLDEDISKDLVKSVLVYGDNAILNWDGTVGGVRDDNNSSRFIDYNKVQLPVVTTVYQLRDALSAYLNNRPSLGMFATYDTFVNTDLVNHISTWVLTITHNLNSTNIIACTITNNSGAIQPALLSVVVDANTITVDIAAPITGTWGWTVSAKV